ncbi:hypothetical protein LguiA_027187 [Lonicera macranthoides]
MESSPTTLSPLLLKNLITSLFIYGDKALVNLGEKYKLLQLIRYILISTFVFFLRLLPSLFPYLSPSEDNYSYSKPPKSKSDAHSPPFPGAGDSGIARALSQLLSIVNEIPVSSRKYEIVRSLTEKIIDDNLLEGNEALREVNCAALSAAFSKTLSQLEARVGSLDHDRVEPAGDETNTNRPNRVYYGMNQVFRAVWYCGDVFWTRFRRSGEELSGPGSSAEKLSAEMLWLAQKLAACGCAEEAVCRWAAAAKLAWLSLSAEPRLQGSLVKVSAFLFKQAKEMGVEEGEENTREQQRQTKMKMLILWLPLLCRASHGTDAPVLSINEKKELERVLEDIIESLEEEEDQEQVLSLWLHHFTHCLSSDWPNLHSCYARWCTASRRLLLLRC